MKALTDEQSKLAAQWVPLACRVAAERTDGQYADIMDAVGDALLQLCRSVQTYDGRWAMSTHVTRAARLAAMTSFRRRLARGLTGLKDHDRVAALMERMPEFDGCIMEEIPDHRRDREPDLETAWDRLPARIRTALEALPDIHRRAVTSYYLDGQSYQWIARKERTNVKTIRMRVYLGVARIRASLGVKQ